MTPDEAIERLYHLKVDTTTRDGDGAPHEKPHKPLLLLAALDLIDEGLVPSRTHRSELTNSTIRTTIPSIIPLSSFGERAQDRLVRGGPCLFLGPA